METPFIVVRCPLVRQWFYTELGHRLARVLNSYLYSHNIAETRHRIEVQLKSEMQMFVFDCLNTGVLSFNPYYDGDPMDAGRWVAWQEDDPTVVTMIFVPPQHEGEVRHEGECRPFPGVGRESPRERRSGPRKLPGSR